MSLSQNQWLCSMTMFVIANENRKNHMIKEFVSVSSWNIHWNKYFITISDFQVKALQNEYTTERFNMCCVLSTYIKVGLKSISITTLFILNAIFFCLWMFTVLILGAWFSFLCIHKSVCILILSFSYCFGYYKKMPK